MTNDHQIIEAINTSPIEAISSGSNGDVAPLTGHSPDSMPIPTVSGGSLDGLRYVGTVLEALEKHFFIGSALISTVGYIIISAFGEMHLISYLLFLIVVFGFYSLRESKKLILWALGLFMLCSMYIYLFELDVYDNTHFSRIESEIYKRAITKKKNVPLTPQAIITPVPEK